jgi:hypothetical protein
MAVEHRPSRVTLSLIRRARGNRSLAELARSPQTSWPSARRLENPRHSPTLRPLERAAAALGKRLVWRWSEQSQGRSIGSNPIRLESRPSRPFPRPAPSRERTQGERMPLGRGLDRVGRRRIVARGGRVSRAGGSRTARPPRLPPIPCARLATGSPRVDSSLSAICFGQNVTPHYARPKGWGRGWIWRLRRRSSWIPPAM